MSKNKFKDFINAVQKGDVKTAKKLCKKWINKKDGTGWRPIHHACFNGYADIAKLLLDSGGQIEAETNLGWRPIHWSCDEGHVTVTKLLLEKGCYVEAETKKGRRPIHCACDKGHIDVVKLLLERGCQIDVADEDGWRPIHHACANGYSDIAKLLLGRGCQLEVKTKWGWQPIHWSSGNGHVAITKLLLEKGCYVEAETKKERRPIHCACDKGHIDVVQLLLERGCQIDVADEDGWRPIHNACANGYTTVVQLLINWQCHIEVQTKWGWRPIHWACKNGHPAIIKLLLNSGCHVEVQTKKGETPLHLAEGCADNSCIRLIEEAQKQKEKTVYSIWHFKDVSVIIRTFKIVCISSVIDDVKRNVLPIDGPIILLGIDNFDEDCYKNAIGPVLNLESKKFCYKEHVVMEPDDQIKDVMMRLGQRRGWDCVLQYPDNNGRKRRVPNRKTAVAYVQLHESADVEFHNKTSLTWMDTQALPVNYCDDVPFTKGGYHADSLYMWCLRDRTMRQVKEDIIFAFQNNLLYAMNQTSSCVENSKYFLERLATNKLDLLLFLSGNESVGGSTKVGDLTLNKQIDIRQRFRFDNVNFIVESDEANLQDVSALSFVNKMRETMQTNSPQQNQFVLKPILPSNPLIIGLSSRNTTVDKVRMALESLLKVDDVILLNKDRILQNNEVLSLQPDSVTDYATVGSYPDMVECKEVGSGPYRKMFRCKEVVKAEHFALQKIQTSNDSKLLLDNELDRRLIREMFIAAKVPAHDRIMGYHAFYKVKDRQGCYFCIRMPLMEGSLSKLLDRKGLEETHVRHFSRQILNGLNHLHRNDVIHGDLRGTNILVDKIVGDMQEISIKLCDFGLAKHLNNSASTEVAQGQEPPDVVSNNWMAPEVIIDQSKNSFKSDVWSFGATVIEMLTGRPPHDNQTPSKMCASIRKGVIKYNKSKTSDELKSFVDKCIMKEIDDRPSCADLLCHPFLSL